MSVQKKIGNSTEKKACRLLQKMGYWCHLFEYNANGQPCDIVALKGNVSYLIDVKHSDKDTFPLSRIEPNQITCFEYANSCGVVNTGFMIYYNEEFYWLPYEETKNGKSVKITELWKVNL